MAESVRTIPPGFNFERAQPVITAREWRLHGSLLILTIVTTTLAGISLVAPEIPVPEPPLSTPLDYLLYLPLSYLYWAAELFKYTMHNPHLLAEGATFSGSLLAILFSHEMGHYLACRYYKVSATLPYFIPAPPIFLAGTFGAFIKIRSPIPTRRALFDIGLAGPLAGFVVALPVAVAGILTVGPPAIETHATTGLIFFNDPLLFRLIAKLAGIPLDPNAPINPLYMAAWIGLLVTSLNLMPVGQLDGGHGTFAVFGVRAHHIIGRIAFVTVVVLAILGFWWHNSPSGFLYAVLLGIMMKVPHPPPGVMEPLGTKRTVVAIITLIVFALCFWPFPISIR
ncbi:MAG TPA: site-2 protease family protein [Pyrinomonadaceae bacterium]|jgi:membrane-associated protease RseP (regulator of RpoE activity)|nr:site-2 protease family protein [Pyrinomonadaceae bacterium]